MKIYDLINLGSSQGSIRDFSSNPVPEKYLKKILRAARWAPSGANTQPWDFIIIKDMEVKEKIAKIFTDAQKKAMGEDKEFPYGKNEELYNRFTVPPILIAVCADTRFKKAYPQSGYRERTLNVSIGLVIQNIILAARALDLGVGWGTVGIFSHRKLRILLGVPSHIRIQDVLQLGFPAKRVLPKLRRDSRTFTHLNQLNVSKLRSDKEIKKLISGRKRPDIYS